MLDLSNVNRGPIDFRRIHAAGQRRVYLKATEGVSFNDPDYKRRRRAAHAAGLKVGAYHFARPDRNSPREEAQHFAAMLGRLEPGKDLRPALDFETGPPSASWAVGFLRIFRELTGYPAILYSFPDFLKRARFRSAPAPLWLASFSRNDGHEHPFSIPAPWRKVVAHQYTSEGRMAGVPGRVDISHVFSFPGLELPKRAGL